MVFYASALSRVWRQSSGVPSSRYSPAKTSAALRHALDGTVSGLGSVDTGARQNRLPTGLADGIMKKTLVAMRKGDAMHKLENPVRVAELNPPETLRRIGLRQGDGFLDVGAGTGLFAFEAAQQTQGAVYAVEISLEMLRVLTERRESAGLANVQILGGVEDVPDGASDLALLSTVLHELEQPEAVLGHIRRALKQGGRLAVIEFHDHITPMGPPVTHRVGEAQTASLLATAGFSVEGAFSLGENMYCLTARNQAAP